MDALLDAPRRERVTAVVKPTVVDPDRAKGTRPYATREEAQQVCDSLNRGDDRTRVAGEHGVPIKRPYVVARVMSADDVRDEYGEEALRAIEEGRHVVDPQQPPVGK